MKEKELPSAYYQERLETLERIIRYAVSKHGKEIRTVTTKAFRGKQ